MLKELSKNLLSFVFPVSCEICGNLLPLSAIGGACVACLDGISLIPAPHCLKCGRFSPGFDKDCAVCRADHFHFDRAYAAVYYDGRVKELLRAFKFARRTLLRETLLEILRKFIQENQIRDAWDGVAAVPMHRKQRLERGFNQAELLARGVSRLISKPFLPGVLISKRPHSAQSMLGKIQRKENTKDRFLSVSKTAVAGKRLLLVDDILTTGETASQCAKVMKDSGAVSVDVLVVARGL